jgi:hypothetical protein
MGAVSNSGYEWEQPVGRVRDFCSVEGASSPNGGILGEEMLSIAFWVVLFEGISHAVPSIVPLRGRNRGSFWFRVVAHWADATRSLQDTPAPDEWTHGCEREERLTRELLSWLGLSPLL